MPFQSCDRGGCSEATGLSGLLLGDATVDQVGPLIYDGRVAYSLTIEPESARGGWELAISIRLSRAEANDLFLSGDAMVTWPSQGLLQGQDAGPERGGMFVSEIAARPAGLRISYGERDQAETAAAVVRARLVEVGLGEDWE